MLFPVDYLVLSELLLAIKHWLTQNKQIPLLSIKKHRIKTSMIVYPYYEIINLKSEKKNDCCK